MANAWILICLFFGLSYCQQYYDPSECSENTNTNTPGSRYTCDSESNQGTCQTYSLYRANRPFQTIASISDLFGVGADEVLDLNSVSQASQALEIGKEVLVPISCSCKEGFFQGNISYSVPDNMEYSEIACDVFQGLVKSATLTEENLSQESSPEAGSKLHVPLKCACPWNFSLDGVEFKYLLTYPFKEGDTTVQLAKKFDIPADDIWRANHLNYRATVYPNTTVLVPLTSEPVIHFIPEPPPPPPASGFFPTTPVKSKDNKLQKLYIGGSVVVCFVILLGAVALGLHVKALKRLKTHKLLSFNTRSSPIISARSSPISGKNGKSSTPSCLSPDVLVGIKYCLFKYTTEEIKKATRDFSEDSRIGAISYKGTIDGIEVMVKKMKFDETSRVIDVHSKINHINILGLLGVCYEDGNTTWSFLVFDHPSNGSLRDCLSSNGSSLHWHRRTQIAFDIVTGLHYLHNCIFPSHVHKNVNSRNVFITADWRAKLSGIAPAPPAAGVSKTSDPYEGWIAPEHRLHGFPSEKVDIFAFGVILFELISGREEMEGKQFKDSIGFLGGDCNVGGCLEQLRSFMDPNLKDDFPLAEALCLAVLAKACVEVEPLHRPSIDDIMKVLARMV